MLKPIKLHYLKKKEARICEPVGMEQSGRAKIRLRVPPIARARSATTSAENALIHPIKLSSILLTLQNLLPRNRRWSLPLQPRLNTLVLIVKIRHVHHQILYHKHMRQRRDRRLLGRLRLDLRRRCLLGTIDGK